MAVSSSKLKIGILYYRKRGGRHFFCYQDRTVLRVPYRNVPSYYAAQVPKGTVPTGRSTDTVPYSTRNVMTFVKRAANAYSSIAKNQPAPRFFCSVQQ